MTPPLVLSGVAKSLAGRAVLSDVTFTCPAGSVTALLGPNGAGKTTTVAMATGLRRPDAGRVEVFGRDPSGAAARRDFSMVPQDISFPDSLGVAVCLDLVERQRAPGPYAPSREELCRLFGLSPLLTRRAGALSGGQKRRLAVVLGLLRAPGLLVLDEATSNLDEAGRATTWQVLGDYARAGGTVLVTTHLLADLDAHADRLVALAGGRVVLQGPLAEVRARLGGTTEVSVQVASERARAVADTLAARFAGHPALAGVGATHDPVPAPGAKPWFDITPAPDSARSVVRWHTSSPLPLVAALAGIAPDANALQVRPVPLGRVLDSLTADGPP